MKVARTTNNPSVSGNILHEATTSLACSSNTENIQCFSHDASVQTNLCTVFQVNPVHTTDLSQSLSDAQITQTTSTCSQIDSDNNLSSFKVVDTELMAKEHESSSIIPVEPMTQKQENASAEISKEEVKEDTLKNPDDHIKTCEKNGTTNNPISNDIADLLDVSSLSIPDCIMHDLQDINLALMETVKKPLKHIAFFQTGNFLFLINFR